MAFVASPVISPIVTPVSTLDIRRRYNSPSSTTIEVETNTPVIGAMVRTPLLSALVSPVLPRIRHRIMTPNVKTPAVLSLFNNKPTPVLTMTTMDLHQNYDYESGLHFDPAAQLQVRDYIHDKFLDDWLPDDFPGLLQFLKVVNGKVQVVKGSADKQAKKVDNTPVRDNEAKIDFIEDRILDKHRTRKILIKIIEENSIKWYDLPHNETLVKHVLAHFVQNELVKMSK